MKIFQMNECDWYAAENSGDALRAMAQNLGFEATPDGVKELREEYDIDDEPTELDDEDMLRLKFQEEEEDGALDPARKITFRQELDNRIAAGDKFPCFFASTEY